ncbi:hypothetical protein LOD99_709 [Oopsacas minuta]|uniref:NADAR domain-containing protein n=1 Tax=Oopsacas minuta TaxID=111878 RepID=A0AAV7K219_9METZ|nr:hypothetical protein LOD99_709 [Oopsacas minuta]
MASSRSYSRGRSDKRGSRQSRERGRRRFPEDCESSKYSLRNTHGRSEGFSNYFEEPPQHFEIPDDFPEGKPSKETYKGDPKNKNTHVEYFWRTESPFSQFHSADFRVNRTLYVCAEQYMMSNKARLFEDNSKLTDIMSAVEPKKMKKYGREVKNFDQDIWKMCCRQYVQEGNVAKFSQNPKLLSIFLKTDDKYFAEASPMDRIWGIGMAQSSPQAANPNSWKGTNWLGEALNLVKYEFQMIIFFSLNKESIDEIPKPNIFDIFKVGICDYFEKMNCKIVISNGKEEVLTVAAKNTKYHQIKKETQNSKKVEGGKIELAANFDVQPPSKDDIEPELANETSEKDSEHKLQKCQQAESSHDSETTEKAPEHYKKKSPSSKRKSSPNMEEAETSKEKFKFQKVVYESNPKESIIPASKRTAVDYILIDWAKQKILDNVAILKCFMRLTYEELHDFPGFCSYQTKYEVITPGITISSVLIKLQKEFNSLEHLFAGQTDLIKDFNCATNIPVFPVKSIDSKRNKNPKGKGKIYSKGQDTSYSQTSTERNSQISIENISDCEDAEKSPIKQDKPSGENPEIAQVKLDKSFTVNIEKLPNEGEPDEPDTSTAENAEISVKERDKSTSENAEILVKELDKSTAENAQISVKEPDESNAEKAEILPKKPDKSKAENAEILPMELGISIDPEKSTTDNTESSIIKPDNFTTRSAESDSHNTAIVDITPSTSPEQEQIEEKQVKRKSKKNKKSFEQDDDDTDSAKRYKNDSEQPSPKTCNKLVSYVNTSSSDQDSPENNEQAGESKKHSSKEPSPETKRVRSEIESEINAESISPDETGEVKEKPIEFGMEKDSKISKKEKKKSKKKLIFKNSLPST